VIRRTLAASALRGLLVALLLTTSAEAASKVAIATLGAAAPGGGVFAGPSFVGEPSAAGNGWFAFRTEVTQGSTGEEIIVGNQVAGGRTVVASIGQTIDDKTGRFKQFLGRPSVNARGDVAFAAMVTPPDGAPTPEPFAPPPGGIFLFSQGKISIVATPGYDTGFGILDLNTPINVLTDESGIDIAERTPSVNDNGDVAFAASTATATGSSGAIFRKRAGQDIVPVLKLNAAYGSGTFQILGPPAINNAGTLAFHALVDGDPILDGIFTMQGDALTLLIRDGQIPDKLPAPFEIDPIFEFGDVVAINDAGDVACTGGPVFDNSDDANLGDLEGSPGAIVIPHGGTPLLVGFPGQRVEVFGTSEARISDVALGPEEGSRIAPPSLTPDGKVIFFAQLNSGSSQAIFRADPVARTIRALVRLGGPAADGTPAGGTYAAASSAPAVDAAGNLVFSARIDNATTSEALIWQAAGGGAEAISIGDAAPEPTSGFFGGPAFFAPALNDNGDVVFRSYVARGPALGIFRYHQGALDPVVRIHDAVQVGSDTVQLSNLVGDPSLNNHGDVAFAATIQGRPGRGIFVSSGGTVRPIALPVDELSPPDPLRRGGYLRTIAANPAISDTGAVVFRGVVQSESRFGTLFPEIRENAIFLADASGLRVIAAEGQESGSGKPFLNFRDPTITNGTILFRATLGAVIEESEGLFLADQAGVRPIAVKGNDVGGMTLDALQSRGVVDGAGDVFFSSKVKIGDHSGGAIFRTRPAGFQAILQTGMTGPEGGQIRSLGRPGVSSNGHMVLRLGFETFTGGVAGLFLSRDDDLRSYMRIGEGGAAGINGRIVSLNQNVSLNANDQVAMLASIGGGRSRSAIMLAAPTTTRVPQLAFKRGPGALSANASPKPSDRLKLSALVTPGSLPPAIGDQDQIKRVRRKAVTIAVADTKGTLWTGTLPSTDVELRGRGLRKKRSASSQIGALKVQFTRIGAVRVVVRSRPFDLSFSAQGLNRRFDETGSVVLEPPFSVRIDVGEDSGSAVIPCAAKGRRFRCRG